MVKGIFMSELTYIRMTDKIIKITHEYAYLKEYCRDYLVNETDCKLTPDFEITVSNANIDYEFAKAANEAKLEGMPIRHFSDEYMETLAVYRRIAERLLDYDTLLFHGSLIAVDGQGYLFAAKSGTGKSTHTRLWREYFKERAIMVNDDKPLLRLVENERDYSVTAYGTPWDGKHRLSTNISVPLKAVCILERSETNHIEPVTVKEAYPMLIQQTYRPKNAERLMKTIMIADRLGKSVELYRLECNMEPEAALVAYNGINAEELPINNNYERN
jgi:hypothetical protein